MSTRSGRVRSSMIETSPPRTRKGISPPRSPARMRKTISPPKRKSSPPVRKSPSRKSPSRKPVSNSRYPARKSPSRTTKETEEVVAPKSPIRRLPIKANVAVNLEDLNLKLESYRNTRSRRVEYSVKDFNSDITREKSGTRKYEYTSEKLNGLEDITNDVYELRKKKPVEEVAPRRSSRLREFIEHVPDIRRSLSKSVSKSISESASQSIDKFSDEENSWDEKFKSKSVSRSLATPIPVIEKIEPNINLWEFGAWSGSVILIFLIPLTVFAILISCTKSCTLEALKNLSGYKTFQPWFSLQAFLFLFAQYIIQAIIAVVPIFGTEVTAKDDKGTKYYFNAFFSCIFTVFVLLALDLYQIINKDVLLYEYLRLAAISYVATIILSIIIHIKNYKLKSCDRNPYANTPYELYDFFMGRDIQPYFKNLNLKIWTSRISNINTLILLMLIFTRGLHLQVNEIGKLTVNDYKQLLSKVQVQPTILIFSLMQITYIMSYIMREYKIISTFYWQYEGLGYLQLVTSALYPFYFASVSKFVADSQLSLSTNILILASVLFTLGYVIMLYSNNIKYEFRRNPLQPSLANLDSMPTFHGKKILVSGVWAVVRRPNYAGDVLVHVALALPGLWASRWVASAAPALTISALLYRAYRDHYRCKRRYGAAWQRYCKRVPSVIIPKLI